MLFYHVAPKEERQQILKQGLRGDPETWADGVWVWDKLLSAEAYATREDDIWMVEASGLNIEPGTNPPDAQGGLAWYISGDVPADRLSLR